MKDGSLEHADFHIGLEFYTTAGKWRCTDVGTRTIVAIKLDQNDPSWYNGPPYAVAEEVFDEDDLIGCTLEPDPEAPAFLAAMARERANREKGRK